MIPSTQFYDFQPQGQSFPEGAKLQNTSFPTGQVCQCSCGGLRLKNYPFRDDRKRPLDVRMRVPKLCAVRNLV